MRYDYLENLKGDIKNYMEENEITEINDYLYDDLFIEDSVTGNTSGSYYCNAWKAQEALKGNEDIVQDMVNEYGVDMNKYWSDYEYLDVSVRCYLLGQALEELKEEKEEVL